MKQTVRILTAFFFLFIVWLNTQGAQAQVRCAYFWNWGTGPGVMSWGGPVMMFIFWILIVVFAILLFRRLFRTGAFPEQESALEILKKRYARGEINKEEFEAKKRDLA